MESRWLFGTVCGKIIIEYKVLTGILPADLGYGIKKLVVCAVSTLLRQKQRRNGVIYGNLCESRKR